MALCDDDITATLDLAAFGDGTLSRAGCARLAAHVKRCAFCRVLLAFAILEAERVHGMRARPPRLWLVE